jgi:hypothetical protein
MRANGLHTLNLLGGQAKDKKIDAINRVRIAALSGYLRGLPSLDFSAKGRATICARFKVNADELAEAVTAQQSHSGRFTPALKRTTGANAPHIGKAKGGAGLC